MSTYEVKDPSEWREGDWATVVKGETTLSGPVRPGVLPASRSLYIVGTEFAVRLITGEARPDCTITVTRTVDDIPEPTGLGAVVKFEDGAPAVRASFWTGKSAEAWRDLECLVWRTWRGLIEFHGPAAAVLSPGVQDGAR